MYRVFVQSWWKEDYYGTLKPDSTARKTTIDKVATEAEAREIAKEYNRTHSPGKLSRKAEYTEI